MTNMLGIDVGLPPLPPAESRLDFIRHFAAATDRRLQRLRAMPPVWFEEMTTFFDGPRSKSWVLLRRLTHSAHHRAQLTVYLRLLGKPLYSTYGPTADTGGLFQNKAPVIYRYGSVEELLTVPSPRAGSFLRFPVRAARVRPKGRSGLRAFGVFRHAADRRGQMNHTRDIQHAG